MKTIPPVVDYRKFRFCKLNEEEFKHLKLLLYWPVYGLLFLFVERFYHVGHYTAVHCGLDDRIPFLEIFLIPYLSWFVYLVGMHVYTLLYDVDTFRKMMKFIIFTYTLTIVIYFLFPTCQELRPEVFERDNILTRVMAAFYQFDTNTNVCPSIHVIGSMAVMFAAWHSRHFGKTKWKVLFGAVTAVICASTVFLKQHSVIDITAALPICLTAYYLCFMKHKNQWQYLKMKNTV